jgi:RNA polymerase sigma factor (sigma-70 family)
MTDYGDKLALVRAAQRGDRASWDALIATTTPRLRRVVSHFRLQSADIDDVVQVTWMAAWLHLPRLREATAFDGWVSRIAEREALRVVHKRDREVTVEELPGEATAIEAAPDEQVVVGMRAAALRGAVGRLPQHQRRIVEALLDEPPGGYDEVATNAHVPIGSIGPTRARSFARLREDVELCAAIAA